MQTRKSPAKSSSHHVQPSGGSEYLEALYSKGVLQVTGQGKVALDPQVARLVSAIHVVLAGGTVDVRVRTRGDASSARALDSRLDKAISEAGALVNNLDPGTYVP